MYNILILLVIVFIKSIFSAADTALTYVNKAKISQLSKTHKRARKIKILMEDKHKFYGVIEVVITMCELLASAIVAEVFIDKLAEKLNYFSISGSISLTLSVIIITIILSYILLVFGAILPKKIARNNPQKIAFAVVDIVWIVSKLNYPFEKLISFSTKIFSKIFRIKENEKDKLTEKEIKMIITEGHEQGVIAKLEKQILFNTLKFDDILVKNIMTPKDKIDFINIEEDKEKILQNIEKYKYTRIPVYETNKDNVIGIFNIKDVFLQYARNKKINLNLNSLIRKVMFVYNNQKISEVFRSMQANDQAIAIAIDNNKKVVGLITMEDILERIVGQIFDEYDRK